MRQILLLAFTLLSLFRIQVQAQTCLSAKTIIPKITPMAISIDTTISLTGTEKWYKIPVKRDSVSIQLNSFLTTFSKRMNKIELYRGPNCSSLSFIAKDSITSINDSLLSVSKDSLSLGDTLYLRTTYISNTYCPSCTDPQAGYRLQVNFYNVLLNCTLCNTMDGCNLVCNGDFEVYNGTYTAGGNISDACGWSNLTQGSCDWYTTNTPSGNAISVPCNWQGNENPEHGNSYAGFLGIPSNTVPQHPLSYGEYPTTKLLSPLILGSTYTVSFYLSQAEDSKLSLDKVGIWFYSSPTALPAGTSTQFNLLSIAPSRTVSTTGLSNAGWTPYSVTFTPSISGLQYMAIGPNPSTSTMLNCNVPLFGACYDSCRWHSYYYLDNISVTGPILLPSTSVLGCEGRSTTLTSSLTGPYHWFNGATTQSISTTHLTSGGYTVTGTSTAGCPAMETFFINGVTPTETITVSPNPIVLCTGQSTNVTASGLSGGSYTWYNAQWFINALPPTIPVITTGTSLSYTAGQTTNGISVFGYASNGCAVITNIPASVVPTPTATINSTDVSMCTNSNLIGTYTAQAQAAGTTYTWSVTCNGSNVPFTTLSGGQSITVNWTAYTGSNVNAQVCLTVNHGCSANTCFSVSPCCVPSSGYTIIPGSSDVNNPTIITSTFPTGLGGTQTGTSVALNGYFTIASGTTIDWSNMRFAMAPGARITVQSGAVLKLSECHFFGCSQMWDGIYATGGTNTIQFSKRNLFEDATNAIVIQNNTALPFSDVFFNKCHIGIDIRTATATWPGYISKCRFTSRNFSLNTSGTAMPSTYLGNSGIILNYATSNYTYYPSSTCLSPYNTSRAHIGVNIADNASVSIGSASTTATLLNVFDNLVYGIHGTNSNVYVTNNKFIYIQENCNGNTGFCRETFTGACPPGTAVCTGGATAQVATAFITKVGLPLTGSTTYPNYFEQDQYGVYNINNRNLDARDNQFTTIDKIAIYNGLSSNYNAGSGFPANTITVQGNKISKADIGVNMNDNRNSITKINTNEFNWTNWSTTTTQQSVSGIIVSNAVAHTYGYLDVSSNSIANLQKGITLTLQGYNGTGTTGRVLLSNNQVRFNQLQTATVAVQHYGIGIFGSKRIGVDGNGTLGEIIRVTSAPATYNTSAQRDLFSGIRIEDSPETWVTDANITGTPGGIYLKGTSTTSNFWCNTLTSNFNGFYLSPSTNISDQLTLPSYSQATTGNQWISTISSRILGTASPSISWYYNSSAGPNFNPTLSFGYTGITFVAATNSADACSYQIPPQDPPGDPSGRMAGANSKTGEIPKKQVVEKQMNIQPDPIAGSDNARNIGGIPELELYPAYLDSMGTEAAVVYNSEIVVSTDAETARKQVDEIHLRSWAEGIADFTTADSAYLCHLAMEDPALYGNAVYSAQVMIGNCETSEGETARVIQSQAIEAKETNHQTDSNNKEVIYPNPNNGMMQADILLKTNEKGVLEIYTSSGLKISSYGLKSGNNSFTIDESRLSAGVYIYHIIVNGSVKETRKLIIIK